MLVVDDDKVTRMLMSRLLQGLGHKVTLAVDGLDAITKVMGESYHIDTDLEKNLCTPVSLSLSSKNQELSTPSTSATLHESSQNPYFNQSFDVILMDNQMPNLSGLDATMKLRQYGVNTPIIGITGNALVKLYIFIYILFCFFVVVGYLFL